MTKTTSTLSHPRASISARLAGRCGSTGETIGKAGSMVGARFERIVGVLDKVVISGGCFTAGKPVNAFSQVLEAIEATFSSSYPFSRTLDTSIPDPPASERLRPKSRPARLGEPTRAAI